MMQRSLFVEPPKPSEIFKPGTQNHRLYERLLQGPVTNAEIVREMNVFNSTGRCSDLRQALKPYLISVEARKINKGLWEYRLS
jgi:hypothetical protein